MKRLQRHLVFVVSFCLVNVSLMQAAHAELVPTEAVARTVSVKGMGNGHARLNSALARADVRLEMQRLGVSETAAAARVAALTDAEAARLADQIESAPAGGIIGAILLVFFVLLFTDIMGWTKVFPFTRSAR